MTRTLRVCAKLHNFLIESASCNVKSPLENDVAGGSGEVHLQGDCELDETRRNRNRDSVKTGSRTANHGIDTDNVTAPRPEIAGGWARAAAGRGRASSPAADASSGGPDGLRFW